MYAVMGITGQVGSVVAETLLAHGEQVRAIVRDPQKAAAWADRGVQLAAADYDDAVALETAFLGVKGVFVMIPPNFAPSPDFREARQTIEAIGTALERARPGKIVYLSSIGAQQKSGLGLITALHLLEEKLDALSIPSAALRAGWFMENSAWDIGRIGAATLLESWEGHRKLEVAGPRRYTPNDIAAALSAVLHKTVDPLPVPRETWVSNFVSQGTPENRTPLRVEMLDAFNSGWIDFGIAGTEHITGKVELKEVIQSLAART